MTNCLRCGRGFLSIHDLCNDCNKKLYSIDEDTDISPSACMVCGEYLLPAEEIKGVCRFCHMNHLGEP